MPALENETSDPNNNLAWPVRAFDPFDDPFDSITALGNLLFASLLLTFRCSLDFHLMFTYPSFIRHDRETPQRSSGLTVILAAMRQGPLCQKLRLWLDTSGIGAGGE